MRINHVVAVAAFGAMVLAACGSSATAAGTGKHAGPAITAARSDVAVQSGHTSLGNVLVSRSGLTLYGLTKDTSTTSNCDGACVETWPPLVARKGWTAASGLDTSLFHTIERSDGTRQLVAGKWPLYTFAGDSKPGDVNGEGTGGFFAVGTDGKLMKSAPASAPMAVGGY